MNTALVIMAAGIGSRFGGGIKQLEPVGPNGEIIMDYSIHDAIAAGSPYPYIVVRSFENFADGIVRQVGVVLVILLEGVAVVFVES